MGIKLQTVLHLRKCEMSDRNVKIFLLLTGFYFISKDVGALVLYNRKYSKSSNSLSNQETK